MKMLLKGCVLGPDMHEKACASHFFSLMLHQISVTQVNTIDWHRTLPLSNTTYRAAIGITQPQPKDCRLGAQLLSKKDIENTPLDSGR